MQKIVIFIRFFYKFVFVAMALETESILRPNLGTSAEVPIAV